MWNHFHTKICQFLLQEPTNVSKKTSSLDIMFGAKLHANPRLVETTNINMVRLLFVYNVHLVVPIPFQLQLYDVCTNPTSWNNHLLCNLQQCDQIAHALAHCDFGRGGGALVLPQHLVSRCLDDFKNLCVVRLVDSLSPPFRPKPSPPLSTRMLDKQSVPCLPTEVKNARNRPLE